jgi:predicted alpha/beta-hydrolase family hydrolase
MLVAEGFACDGLLLAAYPLHPAGQPEKLRDEHLAAIKCPVLCLNGTRDALCDRALMDKALEKTTAPWTMHWIEGADHGFRLLKSAGRTDAQVDAEVGEAAARWLAKLG